MKIVYSYVAVEHLIVYCQHQVNQVKIYLIFYSLLNL